LLERFAGTCEPLGPVDVVSLAAWIAAIDFADWPQQSLRELRPAMVTDLNWYGFGLVAEPVVTEAMAWFPEAVAYQRMLSVVMPGHSIEPHTDSQAPYWLCRVHVPLTSNAESRFVVGGVAHVLKVGMAYRVNTEAEHSVTNDGLTPRIHFMFDIRTP
jgi:hypothetical protein